MLLYNLNYLRIHAKSIKTCRKTFCVGSEKMKMVAKNYNEMTKTGRRNKHTTVNP